MCLFVRFELNKFLINKATESGAKIYFGHSLDESGTTFADDENNNKGGDVGCTLAFNVRSEEGVDSRLLVACHCPVVACDGAGSRARYSMRKDGLTEFTETMLGDETSSTHGYKEMLFPKDSGLLQQGLHIWPRRTHMLMALANLDGSMTGTLYMDMKGEESFESIATPEQCDAFFKTYYPDAIPLVGGMERATSQMLTNPSGILGTVRTSKWNHRGRVLLIGDAAHAIIPFYGQGMNSGFEDVYDLLHVLADTQCKGGVAFPPMEAEVYAASSTERVVAMSDSDAAKWAAAFEKIHVERKPNGDAIADLALINFEEMRDKVADRCFLLQKRVENLVENKFEEKFRSMYAMVVYGGSGNITYANALQLGRAQQTILRDLIEDQVADLYALPEDEWTGKLDEMAAKVSMSLAEELIDTRLVPLQTELGIDLSSISH